MLFSEKEILEIGSSKNGEMGIVGLVISGLEIDFFSLNLFRSTLTLHGVKLFNDSKWSSLMSQTNFNVFLVHF